MNAAQQRAAIKRLLTRARFQRWLDSKPLNAIVGLSDSCTACPLALYLQDVVPGAAADMPTSIWVTNRGVVLNGATHDPLSYPAWAATFIKRLDRLGRGKRCTARRARRILESGQ